MIALSHEAQQARLKQLSAEAERRWPEAIRAVALDNLYRDILRRLMRAQREGRGTMKLASDLLVVWNERDRLLKQSTQRQPRAGTSVSQQAG